MNAFADFNPIVQSLMAGGLTWGVTALGASLVLLTRSMDRRVLDAMLGFASGVMIAASVWSLLIPAIDLSRDLGGSGWGPAALGFLLGGLVLRLADQWLPHLHPGLKRDRAEGIKTHWQRSTLLVLAITLHNIPEGLAIGVAFGATEHGTIEGSLGRAIALAIGIGLQNLPEGVAVALPLRGEGVGRFKAFWYGQLSAVVEPIAAVIGAAAVLFVRPLLPYTLAFAAGAMIYVVVEELVPESQQQGNTDLATLGTMAGFAVMMVLDVSLG
ncbi:ZIP family metal transporter [Tautonia marina]|uniref:ZIP family metal transporter n=1 Tax=Tautonia marina TaxID=2653855 RepID=UPI001261381E|nr:ZIP family metal transporter [Tautonia marina]